MGLEWPQGHVKMSNLAEINAGRIDEVLNDPPSLSYDTGRKYYVLSSQHRRPYVASPEVNDKSFTRSSDSVALLVYIHTLPAQFISTLFPLLVRVASRNKNV